MLVYTHHAVGQVETTYTQFTPERQAVLEEMGEFFDKTIRMNFPAKTDTISHKAFLRCLQVNGGKPESQYILQIDRKKLSEINSKLFEDENYCFFYVKQKDIMNTEVSLWYYSCPFNRGGYLRRALEQGADKPLFRDIARDMEAAGDFSIMLFMANLLNINSGKISDPAAKQFSAFVFWRYLCYCGGVDLLRRKGFCEDCV
ncbi:MAG: hypothetical protein LBC98_06015 [Prevotellaceae bacterium]|jgi:hypothetical protein|nr:hypothetical protein [Prevotellaceae bacterium]